MFYSFIKENLFDTSNYALSIIDYKSATGILISATVLLV